MLEVKIFIVVLVISSIFAIFIQKKFYFAKPVEKSTMKVTSPAFTNNTYMPRKYSCDGEAIHPPLQFLDIPTNAKSLALIVDDPDAPGGTFVHWVVYNIPPTITDVKEQIPIQDAVEGINSTRKSGYTPACPPSGTHRYFFKLYALDTLLAIGNNADKQKTAQAMQNHIITQAELIGLYKRK